MKGLYLRDRIRYLAIILIALVFVSFSGQYAVVSHAEGKDNTEDYLPVTDAIYRVNPLYAGVVSVKELYHAGELKITQDAVLNASDKATTEDEAAAKLREGLKSKTKNIYIYFEFPGTNYDSTQLISIENNVFNSAMKHTGNGSEGDYLKWGYSGMGMQIAYTRKNNVTSGTFTFYMTYYTSAAQESAVTTKVNQISKNLKLSSKGNFDKVLAVYEYVCDNVKYNYGSSNLKYTCYAAACNNSAVCQGYSLLVYRLLNDAGISCRFIAGNTSSGGHGWNIVKIGGVYYNLDATWDAGKSKDKYTYFLKSDSDFDDHSRWSQYANAEFYQAYPMSSESYEADGIGTDIPAKSLSLNKDKLTLKAGGTSQLKISVSPSKAQKGLSWKSSNKTVATVDSKGKVTGVAAGTCSVTVTSSNGKKDTCYITVTGDNKDVKSIKLNKKKLKLKKGKKFQFTVKIKPNSAKNTSLIWISSNKNVARINKKGVVKAKGAGKCTITVMTKNGKKKATCKVTVK